MSKARKRFSSGRKHVPDPDAAFTEAERIIIETATTAYPDIAADWPGLATAFLNTECPFEFDVMKSPAADPNKPVVACGRWTHRKHLLGPSEVSGSDMSLIQARPKEHSEFWTLNLGFTKSGASDLQALSTRVSAMPSAESLASDAAIASEPTAAKAMWSISWEGPHVLQQVAITRGHAVIVTIGMYEPIVYDKLHLQEPFKEKHAKHIVRLLSD